MKLALAAAMLPLLGLTWSGDARAGAEAGGELVPGNQAAPHFSASAPSAGTGSCAEALAEAFEGDALVNCAEDVRFEAADGPAPVAAGGVVADGVYALTAVRVYGGQAPSITLRGTYVKQGDQVRAVLSTGAGTPETQATGTLSFAGASSRFSETSPEVQVQRRGYSVTGDVWLDLDVEGQRTVAYEFTRVR